MATTSTWSSRALLAAALLVPSVGHAAESRCPTVQAGEHLSSATVFDGPPSEHADLMPDSSKTTKRGSRSEWQVGYVFEAHRQLYVECKYGEKPSLVITPATGTRKCAYLTDPRGANSLVCS